jgi:predicted TIM-barrel fold metal-dependent hydrolase
MRHSRCLGTLPCFVVLLMLPASCKGGADKIVEALGSVQEEDETAWKARRVCAEADRIPIFDSHINMSPEAVEKTLALNKKWRVEASINVMGGYPGDGLEDDAAILLETEGRIQFMCNIDWSVFGEDYFIDKVLKDFEKCKEQGAVGIKIFKSLGLGIENSDGTLLKVDDPVLDPIFEKAGELGLPVLIHSGDPKAFFKPITEDNERYDELKAHPSWHFGGKGYPTWEEVYKQFLSRVARHPKTRFIGSHFGNNPEDPPTVFAMMEKYPNLYVYTSARIPEIGRFDAKKMHAYFKKFGDRILYGSDLGIGPDILILGSSPPRHPTEKDEKLFFNASYRYFETWDKQFAHPTPIQGRWKIDGIGLPCDLLHKVYHENAEKLFGVKPY